VDAFISHSSRDAAIARRLERELEQMGLAVWLDDSEIRVGALLREELQASIAGCKALVLLWSANAQPSRWVAAEWLTAIHSDRPVLAVALDSTALPQCLSQTVFLDTRRDAHNLAEHLARAIRASEGQHPAVAPVMRYASPELEQAIATINAGQEAVIDQLSSEDTEKAAELQTKLDGDMQEARRTWPLDPEIVNLDGYHLKNAYLVRHWAAVQAGRAPADPLLAQAEQRFFETLAIDPYNPGALNGLGSVLIGERELDAAEFFILAAIKAAKERGLGRYPAAEHDLALVRGYKAERRKSER
jgi:TIR domain